MAPNNGIVNRLRGFDAKHYAATDRYARIIEKLFNMASDELAQAARNASYDPSSVFSFNDFPATRRQAQQILSRLVGQLEHVIDNGTKAEWLAACDKNDAFINAILRSSKLSRAEVEQYEDRNLEALRAFQNRKTNGLGLSQRVWSYAGNFVNEVELGIDAALGDGTPAANLARSLRQHLKEPERIYRRFRIKTGEDENGNPIYGREWKRREYDPETGTFRWVKDDPADYHPGTGVYRSSVKNTMRLARTEINMAYREAEYLRWQQLDFVVGFRVCLSNNHTIINPKTEKKEPLTDICDELAGDYPKTFKFLGWHPNCRCYVVPIMEDYDEYNKRRAGRLKAIVRRERYTSLPSRRQVTDVPPNFRKYIESIADRSKGWKSQPYYIRDNFVGGRIAGGLKPSIPTKTMNDVQPCTDYDAEIATLRRWAYAFGLDLSNIDALRTSGNRNELKAAVEKAEELKEERTTEWTAAKAELTTLLKSVTEVDLFVEGVDALKANEINISNYYQKAIDALKRVTASIRAKFVTPADESKKMPSALRPGKDWLDKDEEPFNKEFFDLLKRKPTVDIPKTGKGSYETDNGNKVVLDSDPNRTKPGSWYRRGVVYHEFGHAIGDQRDLVKSKELTDLRKKHEDRLRKREKAVIWEKKTVYDPVTRKPVVTRVSKEVNQMRGKTIDYKLEALYNKVISRKADDPVFKRLGISKEDLKEQILAVRDTLKSLIVTIGAGHSTDYFKKGDHAPHEYLAHCFENAFAGNQVFKAYAPDIYNEMIDFVKSLKNP